MKYYKYKIAFVLLGMLLFSTSCDENFAEINTDPTAAININPNFQFTYVQLRTSGGRYENWRAGLIYSSMMIQHLAATCGYWTGDKYTFNGGYASSLIDRAYNEQVKDAVDLINTLQTTDAGDETMLGMARIWKVVIFQRLTDLYGDVPYFEAGKGVIAGIDFPLYDSQESIYMDMLNELEQGVAQLGDGGFGDADLLYGGDVDKWRKFGNSMMLRLAMRLSEVDAGTAQAWAAKAIAGGVMDSNDDDAFIEHTNGPEGINKNGIGEVLDKANGFGDDCPRLSDTFVNWMSSKDDPRLEIIAIPSDSTGVIAGMPNGLDEALLATNPTGTSVDDFSRINPAIVKVSSPMMFMTAAEAQLLSAEAAVRGWHGGDASSLFSDGVALALGIWMHYDPALALDEATISEYVAANSLDESDALSQIGWQYWAATFLNEYEAFSNYRRLGFPDLTPVDYPGNITNGQIPVRLANNPGEATLNPSWQSAADRQGLGTDFPSHMSVPVWWDK